MKHLIILIGGFLTMTIIFSFIPPHQGHSQDTAVKPIFLSDTLKKDTKTDKNIDTANALVSEIKSKLVPPRIEYRTRTRIIVKHSVVKVPVHDTVYMIETRYVAVPTDTYKFKQFQHYNDSVYKVQHPKPIKKKHKFLFL